MCVVSELADISPDDDLQYAFDTFSWYRHLYQESQIVLTPQTLEATRLNNDTSAARAAALLAEVAAELAEFEEEVQAAISSNKRMGDVSASHKKKVQLNTAKALASEDFVKHYLSGVFKKDAFPAKAIEQWKNFCRDVMMWEELSPTDLALFAIVDFSSHQTYRESLVKKVNTFLNGVDPMITLFFYPAKPKTRSQRRKSTPDASVGGAWSSWGGAALSGGSSDESPSDDGCDGCDGVEDLFAPLPEDLTGRPLKVRRTDGDLHLQLAKDTMAFDQNFTLGAPASRYPVRVAYRQGPGAGRGNERFEQRPACSLLPNHRSEEAPWFASLTALDDREVTIPWCSTGVSVSRAAARAATGPLGSVKDPTSASSARWPEVAKGSGCVWGCAC